MVAKGSGSGGRGSSRGSNNGAKSSSSNVISKEVAKGTSKGILKKDKPGKKVSPGIANTANTANIRTSLAIPSKKNPLSFLSALKQPARRKLPTESYKIPRKPLPIYDDEYDNYHHAHSNSSVPNAASCPDNWRYLDRSKGQCSADWVDALLAVGIVLALVAIAYLGFAGAIGAWLHKKILTWRNQRKEATKDTKTGVKPQESKNRIGSKSQSMLEQEDRVVTIREPEMAHSRGGNGFNKFFH
ncbi:MAG: hypothetical protein Q9167_003096 [Letrouitia subvulpina]